MKKYLIIAFLQLFFWSCYNQETLVDKNKLVGSDYRLFQQSKAWELAKAVQDEDTVKIAEEVKKGVPVDYQETRFGHTLLMMAIQNYDYKSVKYLLHLGANPNLRDHFLGGNSVIEAARSNDPKYLKILLEYHGDPNSLENASQDTIGNMNVYRTNAINEAIAYKDPISKDCSLQKVKLLVKAGADINYSKGGGPLNLGITSLPLGLALMHDNMDIVLYLLEKGADYKREIYNTPDHKVFILEALRNCLLDLDSEQYKQKMSVISWLRIKGLEYNKEPIPDYILVEIKERYPENWKKYIQEY